MHTAAIHRVNLPQIRCDLKRSKRGRELSLALGAQVILESAERSGSMRRAAREVGVDVLVYEGGEGLRFDEFAIQAGVDGVARVMLSMGMLDCPECMVTGQPLDAASTRPALIANAAKWVRAPEGGVLRTRKRIGDAISQGETIGVIASPYEESDTPVLSPRRGIIVGTTTLPIVNMGDALFHLAWNNEMAGKGSPPREAAAEPVMDEDEII